MRFFFRTLKSNKVEVTQPPDLWIHHDRLELKNIDNHNPHSGSSRPSSPLHATTVLSHAGSHFFLSSLTLNSFAYLALFFCFKFSCCYFTACFLSDTADLEDKNTTYTSTSTLDRRTPYHSTYLSKLSIVVTTIVVTTIEHQLLCICCVIVSFTLFTSIALTLLHCFFMNIAPMLNPLIALRY